MTATSSSVAGILDDVNKAIVEQLQQDGRRTYGSIAEAVGLSEAAVRQRVQKMRDAGIMQIVAVTDPLQVGFRRQAMVAVLIVIAVCILTLVLLKRRLDRDLEHT